MSQDIYGSLNEINVQAQKVSDLIDEISVATQEQAQGISQINKAISQMEQVIQSNASTAQQSATASEELSSQAENVKEIVGSLALLVEGVGSVSMTSHHVLQDRSRGIKALPDADRSEYLVTSDF